MKKFLCMLLALVLALSIAACTKSPAPEADVEAPEAGDSVETVNPDEAPAAEPEAEPEIEAEPEAKPEEKPEAKPEAKPETKPEAKPEAKPEVKPEAKPEVKPEVKPETTPEAKPEPAPEVKPEPEAKPEASEKTVGETLASVWRANSGKSAEEIANTVITHSSIPFAGGINKIEEGYLAGFDNVEIKGFSNGYMFGPMMGTIPFVGYVFELADGTDADAFVSTLKENANLRWNICTEAEQTIVEKSGNKVFFLMCKKSFEE